MVSPSCASLAFDVGCCVLLVSEYPLEPWLSRSFGLGRKALTSAFHSESTTGHVDHGLLQNTYLHASPSSLSLSPTPFSPLSPLTSLSPFFSPRFFLVTWIYGSVRRAYTRILGYVDPCVNLETSPCCLPLPPAPGEPEDPLFLRRPTCRPANSTVRNHYAVGGVCFSFDQRPRHRIT